MAREPGAVWRVGGAAHVVDVELGRQRDLARVEAEVQVERLRQRDGQQLLALAELVCAGNVESGQA